MFQSIIKSQIIPNEINNVNKCQLNNNNYQSSLSNNDIIYNDLLMANEDWPGDRIFDKQCLPDDCIKSYDDYLAEIMSKISGLPISSKELPNISPCGDIIIDHMNNSERCSIQCIANQHVLS
ncbi:unnamed protein product, partial [Rotaria sp. Silwood2]